MVEHYFSETQSSEFKIEQIEAVLRGGKISLKTGSGVFSIKRVDKGSELLANSAIIKERWRVLDLGCGYGAVGIAVKKAEPSTEVVFTDINRRAVFLTKENLKLNKIEGDVVQGDCFEKIKGKFDTILLNPPQTAGKKLCFRMIEESKIYLKKGGMLQIVARHKKGGASLSKEMQEVFNNFEVLAKKSGYRIYISKNDG
ncbi:class I SAM-dependent methyltransferase [Thermoproteota archaeon]